MTLLDSAMGCAVQTHMPAGGGYTTLEAKTNLTRPITSQTGKLRAIGKVLHLGSRFVPTHNGAACVGRHRRLVKATLPGRVAVRSNALP